MASQRARRRAVRAYSHDKEWRKKKDGSSYDDPGLAGLTDERPSTGRKARNGRKGSGPARRKSAEEQRLAFPAFILRNERRLKALIAKEEENNK